ncbi:MAG TPA: DUF4382 domain-containing protein [Candidatus Nanoarchaeia archaeon]|nr:DUF4382 domain-containing protein [Candidatus Nanoarchaeia archaeon]
MNKLVLFGAFVLALLFIGGCGQKSTTGTLVLELTDAPANYEKVEVTISSVMVHLGSEDENSTQGWFSVVETPQTFDLIAVKDVNAFLGSTVLEPGRYTQVRLSVDQAKVTVDGTEYDVKVPSKIVKLIRGFTIEANKTTTLTLDFDAQKSVHKTSKDNYSMRPTIMILQEGEEAVEPVCFATVSTSAEAANHVHVWCEEDEYTADYCNDEEVCHTHLLNEAGNLAEAAGAGPHTHALK